jgi:hypothetical protein
LLEHLSAALYGVGEGTSIATSPAEGRNQIMKTKIAIGSLLVSGLLLASDQVTVNRVSYFERQGLESQSPRVHTKGMEKHKKYDKEGVAKNQIRDGYRVVSDKQTVNAFIPEGK